MNNDKELCERFKTFATKWHKFPGRADEIYEFTDSTRTHAITASDLDEAAARIEALNARVEELEKRNRLGEGAIQIVAAISALVPPKDCIEANKTGASLVAYIRQALKGGQADD